MRLIDADALGIGLASSDVFSVPEYADGWNNAVKIIMAAPTVDAAPIVKCKYCEKRYMAECLMEVDDGRRVRDVPEVCGGRGMR
jgi:hypothetical protein